VADLPFSPPFPPVRVARRAQRGRRYRAGACAYTTVKDRKNSKRAALSEARKIVRQACHILAEPSEAPPSS